MLFRSVDAEVEIESPDQIKTLNLDSIFLEKLSATKLVIEESGVRAESGVKLEAPNGQHLLIVAGDYPYSLFVEGADLIRWGSTSEYELADYQVVEF